jgi:hypothetical protein
MSPNDAHLSSDNLVAMQTGVYKQAYRLLNTGGEKMGPQKKVAGNKKNQVVRFD